MRRAERHIGQMPDRQVETKRKKSVGNFPQIIDQKLQRLHPMVRLGQLALEHHDGFDAYYQRDLYGNHAEQFLVEEQTANEFGASDVCFMFTVEGSQSIKRTIITNKHGISGEINASSRMLSSEEIENLLAVMIVPEIYDIGSLPKGLIDLNAQERAFLEAKGLYLSEPVLAAPQPIE